jgi:hypothetical protein
VFDLQGVGGIVARRAAELPAAGNTLANDKSTFYRTVTTAAVAAAAYVSVQGVAEIVARRAAEHAAAGNVVARRCLGLIDRKVVKQTVMTSVYGVTAIGARAQVSGFTALRGIGCQGVMMCGTAIGSASLGSLE